MARYEVLIIKLDDADFLFHFGQFASVTPVTMLPVFFSRQVLAM
ncbi:MAG TPA: hypothetical protein VK436_00465 [Methanocella sp.]|nr:hypothetical protein [Methanocella sp.]